jgi:hypothetical protein
VGRENTLINARTKRVKNAETIIHKSSPKIADTAFIILLQIVSLSMQEMQSILVPKAHLSIISRSLNVLCTA